MMWAVALGIVVAVATGVIVLAALWPEEAAGPGQSALCLVMAVLLGFGLHSIWHLVWLVVTDGADGRPLYVVYDVALPVCSWIVLHNRFRLPVVSQAWKAGIVRRLSTAPLVLLVICAASVVFTTLRIVASASAQPYGLWDAWANWNLKASWFALGGDAWARVLTDETFRIAQPDYPLLLPLSIARLWLLAGGTPPVVPQGLAVAALVITVALLFAIVRSTCGFTSACVAVAALFIVPHHQVLAAWQYADVPLGAFYLAALAAISVAVASSRHTRWALLAGLFAGAAVWTKNEGALLLICAVVVVLGVGLASREGRTAWMRAGALLAGAAPFLCAVVAMKLWVGVPNELASDQSVEAVWRNVQDPSRHAQILHYSWFILTVLPDRIGLVILTAYLALSFRAAALRPALAVVLTIALTAVGYYGIYLATPRDLDWHLSTSASRLFVQLWPGIVFSLVLFTRSVPETDRDRQQELPAAVAVR